MSLNAAPLLDNIADTITFVSMTILGTLILSTICNTFIFGNPNI